MLKLGALFKSAPVQADQAPPPVSTAPVTQAKPGNTGLNQASSGSNMRSKLHGMFKASVDSSGKKKYEVAQGYMSQALDARHTFAKTTSMENLGALAGLLEKNDLSGLQLAARNNGMLRKTTTGLQSVRQMCQFASLDGKPVTTAEQYFSASADNLLNTEIKDGTSFQSMGTMEAYKEGPLSTGLTSQRQTILEHMDQVKLLGVQLAQYEASPESFRVPVEPMAAHAPKVEHAIVSYAGLPSIMNSQRLEDEAKGPVSRSDAAELARRMNASTASVGGTESAMQAYPPRPPVTRNDSISTMGSAAPNLSRNSSVSSMGSAAPNLSRSSSLSSTQPPSTIFSEASRVNSMATTATDHSSDNEAEIETFEKAMLKEQTGLKRSARVRAVPMGEAVARTDKANPKNPANPTGTLASSRDEAQPRRIDRPALRMKTPRDGSARSMGKIGVSDSPDKLARTGSFDSAASVENQQSQQLALPKRKPLPAGLVRTNRLEVFRQARPLLSSIGHGAVSPQENPLAYNKLEKLASNAPELARHMLTLLGDETPAQRQTRQAHGTD